jgi:hypothetical protein
MRRFEKTEDSPYLSWVHIYRTFLVLYWTKSSRSTRSITNCVQDGLQKCWQMITKQRAWAQHWTFWYSITMKVKSFLTTLWQEMKLGFPMWHQRISSSQCNGGIVHLQRQRHSSRRFPPRRSRVPCFGQTWCFAHWLHDSRHNNKRRCLLWHCKQVTAVCSKQNTRPAQLWSSFASR